MRIACSTQRTQEWFDAKRGLPSASQAWRVMDFVSKGSKKRGDKRTVSGAQRERYMLELATEIISGETVEHYVSPEMDYGSANESAAIREYLFVNDADGGKTGFVLHPTMDRFGVSPDLLRDDRGAEFKCPKVMTHMEYLRLYARARDAGLEGNSLAEAVIPKKYLYQCHSCILCCEKPQWDWVSFLPPDPDRVMLPPDLRMLQIPIFRDQAWIDRIEEGVQQFNEQLLSLVVSINEAMEGKPRKSPLKQQLRESIAAVTEHQAYTEAAEFVDRFEMTP